MDKEIIDIGIEIAYYKKQIEYLLEVIDSLLENQKPLNIAPYTNTDREDDVFLFGLGLCFVAGLFAMFFLGLVKIYEFVEILIG